MAADGGPPLFDLAGKHALVTAATGPLARSLAVALAEAGADVSVTTLHDDAGEAVQANSILNECWSIGRRGQARRLELTDPAAVGAAVASLEGDVGPIDILVNAAHGANIKPVLEASLEDWEREIARNATSVFVATQAVGRGMLERERGRVVNIVSVLGERAAPNCALFAASQGAVLAFTKSVGLEWARRGVTVNALGVGFFESLPGPQADPEVREILERFVPLGRLGRPEDLQGALIYLVSDEAAFVDSAVFPVDGAIQLRI